MQDGTIKLEDLFEELAPPPQQEFRINIVALVGGGIMGQGIAQTLASQGINTIIIEKDEAGAANCLDGLGDFMDREIQRWAMTNAEKKSILARIKITTDIETATRADFVMEVVDEQFDLKQKIFRHLDAILPPETIIASNTSTLSLTKITRGLKRKDKVIGLHFGNPVQKTPLCEIIRAFHTSDATFQITRELIQRMGKTAVEVYEYPGFIMTRTIIPMLNEAMHILMEGVATAEDIDTAMRLGFNFPMGPLELADTIGLEELLAWMESMFHELGDAKYRPCPLLRRLVREQKYGKKSGEGFFRYNDAGQRIVQGREEERRSA